MGDGTKVMLQIWVEGVLNVYDDETEDQALQRLGAIGFTVENIESL